MKFRYHFFFYSISKHNLLTLLDKNVKIINSYIYRRYEFSMSNKTTRKNNSYNDKNKMSNSLKVIFKINR